MRIKIRPALQSLLIAPNEFMRNAILSGEQTGTIREDYRDYHRGFCSLDCPKDPFCVSVDITSVRHSPASRVRREDYLAAGFATKTSMMDGLESFYTGFNPRTPVTAIQWANVRGQLVDDFKRRQEKSAYILCPVRGSTAEERSFLESYVASLESLGYKVHYPPRDVEQDDPIGLDICSSHREAMRNVNEVHVYWNPASEGSKFDFGMAFMADAIAGGKRIVLINKDMVPKTPHKSFGNVLLALHER